MTVRKYIEIDFFSLLAAAAIVGVVIAVTANHSPRPRITFSVPVMDTSQTFPSLDPAPKEVTSQVSPDGTQKVTMTVVTNRDNSKAYTVTTSNLQDGDKKIIYTTTLPATDSMTIPFNTWSPDNNYILLKHVMSQKTDVLVLRADGQALPDGKYYDNVTDIFLAKNTGSTYEDTTGWASETLLIINTKSQDGSKGPSYWEEVPTQAVIELSTQF